MRLGKPDQKGDSYQVIERNNVVLYIHPDCQKGLAEQDILLELESVLFGKKLVLYGFPIEQQG